MVYSRALAFAAVTMLFIFFCPEKSLSQKLGSKAIVLNNVNDYVAVPTDPTLQPNSGNFTFECWIKRRGAFNVQAGVIGKGSGLDLIEWQVQINPDGRWQFDYGNRIYPISSNILDTLWHHLAATVQRVGDNVTINAYFDGNDDGVATGTFSGSITNTDSLFIGANRRHDAAFVGYIDEVRLWNIVRTKQDIQASQNVLVSGVEPGLVACWRFDDNTDDMTANGHNGVLNGNATFAYSDSPVSQGFGYYPDGKTVALWHLDEISGSVANDVSGKKNQGTASGTTIAEGKFGNARSFNGSTDYVTGSSSSFNFGSGDFTMEAWAKTSSSAPQAIFTANSTSNSNFNPLGLFIAGGSTGGFFDLDINNGPGTSTSNSNGRKVNDGNWHHVAGVRSGAKIILYVDGQLDFQKDVVQDPQTSNYFNIGKNANAADFFNGMIDEVRVSNVARSQQEILAHVLGVSDATTLWKLQIAASAGAATDNSNYLGVSQVGTDGFDPSLDLPKPPTPPGNFVQVYFPHPEYNQPTGDNYAQDIRAVHALADTVTRWNFVVNTNQPGSTVTLQFFSDGRIPSDFGMMLKDIATNTRKNLKTGMSYTYTADSSGIRNFQILIGDSTSPSVTVLKPNGAEIVRSGRNYTVLWNSSDRMGIDSVQLYYSTNAGGSYSFITTLLGNQSSYSWQVPPTYLSYSGMVKVVVNDSMGNVSSDTSNHVFTIVGDSLSSSFGAGWNLFGTALRPNDSTVAGIFADDVSSGYYVYGYSPSAGYTIPTSLKHGRGYWLGLLNDVNVDVIGAATTDSNVVGLDAGFNIISNPLVVPVPRDSLRFMLGATIASYTEALANGWIVSGLQRYNRNTNSYENVDSLQIWGGYWFASLQAGVKLLVMPPGPPIIGSRTISSTSSKSSGWQATITASTPIGSDNSLTFGVKADATDGFDPKYDLPKPPSPPVSKYVEEYFNYPDWAPVLGSKFSGDIRSPQSQLFSWRFSVRTTDSVDVTLSWDPHQLSSAPGSITLELTDLISGDSTNMKTKFNYAFRGKGLRQFEINGIVTGVTSPSIIPQEFRLAQNFPNPFNPSTTIRYDIPTRSRVKITVIDLLGREIAELANRELEAGYYSEVWNAKVASGIYFYRIEATAMDDVKSPFVQVKKMILLK